MNFVVGDIHGEKTKLILLLTNILSIDINASFIFIGDSIDKGEDPYSTLKHLQQFSDKHNCIFLRGNHEYYWELLENNEDQYADYLLRYGGLNTIHSVNKKRSFSEVKAQLFKEFRPFFSSLKNYHSTGEFIITHSGIPPELYTTPIENIPLEKLLFNRYDFIKTKKMYFNKKIIFGHTGFYSPFYDGFKIGIDTAACYLESQPITAFCTNQEFFINSANETTQLSSIDLSICPTIPRIKAWRTI